MKRLGFFSNDDALANAFLAAGRGREARGQWRMPLGAGLRQGAEEPGSPTSPNVGGRPAGAITAAQFLQRFVKQGVPWVHLDIAGVAYVSKDLELGPKGATGWGVRALDRLVGDKYQG